LARARSASLSWRGFAPPPRRLRLFLLFFAFPSPPPWGVLPLQVLVKRGAPDPPHFSGARLIPACLPAPAPKRPSLHLPPPGRGKRRYLPRSHLRTDRLLGPHRGRKVLHVDDAMITERHRSRDAILEFAHISGPLILQKAFHRRGRDRQGHPRRVSVQE